MSRSPRSLLLADLKLSPCFRFFLCSLDTALSAADAADVLALADGFTPHIVDTRGRSFADLL